MKEGGGGGQAKRPYRMRGRAAGAEATGQRILDAALALFAERWLDQITLEEVAARAGVTVQTVIRRYGSKEGLIAAAGAAAQGAVERQRAAAPVDDLAGAVRTLLAHYEEVGDRVLRLLAQEGRWPALRPLAEAGRVAHRAWVERVVAPALAAHTDASRARVLAAASAVTDVYVWHLLRHDQGLTRDQTERALREMLAAVLGSASATGGGLAPRARHSPPPGGGREDGHGHGHGYGDGDGNGDDHAR